MVEKVIFNSVCGAYTKGMRMIVDIFFSHSFATK